MKKPYYFDDNDIIIEAKITTKASKTEIQTITEEHVKIRINTPPVDGKANSALKKFLGKAFHTAPSNITIESGELSNIKRFRIKNYKSLPEGFDDGHA